MMRAHLLCCFMYAGLGIQQSVAATLPQTEPVQRRLSEELARSGFVWPSVQGHVQWLRASKVEPQRAEKQALIALIRERAIRLPGRAEIDAFLGWWEHQPVTGAEWIPEQDPAVLALHPELDPWLASGDEIRILPLASSVAYLDGRGQPCALMYLPRASLRDYVASCAAAYRPPEFVWLVNPGQRPRRVGIASWNAEIDPLVMPGAWILPPNPLLDAEDQQVLAQAIASLGPFRESAARMPDLMSLPVTDLVPTSGDFGGIGLMQTPTARFREAGEVALTLNHVQPYTRYNIMLQPLDWLEAGLRYTEIRNKPYGPEDFSGNQTYKDKSIDVKFRLAQEGTVFPQLALGFRDVGGTGLFGSEYLVASKRHENLDFTLGLGWGNMASRGTLANPMSFLLSDSYDKRELDNTPGAVNNDYFKGPANFFGGIAWHILETPVTLKAEYDANSYQKEGLGNRFDVALPINFGANYRLGPLELQAALERGNAFSIGLTYHGNISRLATEKVRDVPSLQLQATAKAPKEVQDDWQGIARGIQSQAGSEVLEIRRTPQELQVVLSPPGSAYVASRIERAGRVLHSAVDGQVKWFDFKIENAGLPVTQIVVDRHALVQRATTWVPEAERMPVLVAESPRNDLPAEADVLYRKEPARAAYRLGLDYSQNVGGPDGFLLFQIDAVASGRFNFSPDAWLYGSVRGRLYDSYGDFKFDAPSGLPRVRTDIRRYLSESPAQITNLQLTKVKDVSDDMFVMFYGGYLERMFAGLGAEWLLRPHGSPVAIGADINRVQQRDFDGGFALLDYKVTTGHVSLYLDTGIQDILATFKVGRYLAGDAGFTVDFSRIFRNGVVMGAYATVTSASSVEYGEGSFSKGMYMSVPFDVLFDVSSRNVASFNWTPLTRDGGALLARPFSLYGLTDLSQPRSLGLMPFSQ